jgi:hypothetical protein
MAKSKENKSMLELGQKQRAGRLLSEYIRAIGDEKTELVDVVVSPDKCERRLVSKAEALARDIWKQANEGDDKLKFEYRKLIIDRIEGKVGTGLTGADIEHPGRSIPDRMSGLNRDRVNRIAKSGEKKSKKT